VAGVPAADPAPDGRTHARGDVRGRPHRRAVPRRCRPDGRPWPALSGAKLGTGEPGGYRAFARRLVTLSAILSLAVVGGALVRAATGSVALALPAVVALSVCGVASVPTLEADTLRAGLARVGFHLAGLAALAWFARPFDPTVGVTSAPLAYALVVGCTVADSWPVGRRLRERLRRSDRTG
jgi:hypothetical protein